MKKSDLEILLDLVLNLPISYDTGECEDVIYDRIEKYHDCLLKAGIMDSTMVDCVRKFNLAVKTMYDEYYAGQLKKAYSSFKVALAYGLRDIDLPKAVISDKTLYRARINTGSTDFRNDEMFHIKFNSRPKVSSQRFSFPGLPCLYLGSSSYVCWMELDRPSFDQFQVASIRTKPGKNVEVLDLSIHPHSLYTELVNKTNFDSYELDKKLKEYLTWWPVIAACSIKVKNPSDTFKPEYIFPQFLLQCILEKDITEMSDIKGIKYMSIKAAQVSQKQYDADATTYTNYVIPVQSIKSDSGLCKKLQDIFIIFKNYSGKELQIISDMIREGLISLENAEHDSLDDTVIWGTGDIKYPYGKSIFRRIEKILNISDIEKYINDRQIELFLSDNETIKETVEKAFADTKDSFRIV